MFSRFGLCTGLRVVFVTRTLNVSVAALLVVNLSSILKYDMIMPLLGKKKKDTTQYFSTREAFIYIRKAWMYL